MKTVVQKTILVVMFSCFFFLSFAYGEEIPILMYHNIAEQTENTYVTITPQQFQQDMTYLYTNGFTPLLPEDLVAISEKRQVMPVRPVMITFDDGYESNYLYAYPILKKLGMKATIAVISGHIQSVPFQQNGYLTWAQCKEMSDSGFLSIQSHSHNLHNPENFGNAFVDQPNGIQRKAGETFDQYQARVGTDLAQSISAIESHVGKPVIYFAYPFGAVDTWFSQLPAFANIKVTTTTTWKTASLANGLQNMPRFDVGTELPIKDMPQLQSIAKRTEFAYPQNYSLQQGNTSVTLPSYLIRDERYLSLEALAQTVPNGFSVTYEPNTQNIWITPVTAKGMPYVPQSTEEKVLEVTPSNTHLVINGSTTPMITYYAIGGNHYFRLKDISPYLPIKITPENQLEVSPLL